MTLREAAQLLGVSKDAVRQRIRRGTIRSEKGEDGRVYVFVEPDQGRAQDAKHQAEDESELAVQMIEEMRDQVRYLRDQLRREQDAHGEARRIIAALTQRIPELEPPGTLQGTPRDTPTEPREWPVTATEQPGRVGPQTEVEAAQEPAEAPTAATDIPMGPIPSEASEEAQEQPSDALGGPGSGTARGSWWRRLLGG